MSSEYTKRDLIPLGCGAAVAAIVILVVVLVMRGCYGWCCDRLAESLSRVHGGDKNVVVADGLVIEDDVVRLAGREAHGAVEDVADAVRGSRLDAKDEAGARGSVDDHGADRAHGVAEHVHLVLRLEPGLPKKEAKDGSDKPGKNLHGGDYTTTPNE